VYTTITLPEYTDTRYVNFDGENEIVTFSDSTPIAGILDFDQDWSFGFKLGNTWNVEQVGTSKLTVVRNGNNSFYIQAANTPNASPYVQNGALYSGLNSRATLVAGDRVVVTYDSAQKRFRYYLNGVPTGDGGGTWVLRAGLTNESNGVVTLAEGGGFGQILGGGLDDVFFATRTLSASEAAESAAVGNPKDWSFYDDPDLVDVLPMGENTFPNIIGIKGILEGTMINAEPEDFVEY